MSNTSSSTLDEVIGNVIEEVLRERVEKQNQGISLEVVPEEIEVVVEKEKPEPSTPTREKKHSRSIWPRRALWRKDDSRSWCHHLRRKSSDRAGRR